MDIDLHCFNAKVTWRIAVVLGILILPGHWYGEASAQDQEKPGDSDRDGGEILVIGDVPPVKNAPGVTQYDVSNNLQGETGSVADVLNTLPSVTVTSDGVVSVRGRTDVEVLVDGRPSASMNGDSRGTTLQTMPGSDIKSIEIITNPTVGMESGGSSVINLKLKKEETLGPRASISANIDHRKRSNISLDSSYGWQDVKLDFDANYRENIRLDGVFTTRRFINPAPDGIALTTILAEYTPTNSHAGNVQGKIQYVVSDNTKLGGSFNYTRYVASNLVAFLNTDFDASGQLLDRNSRIRDARLGKHDGDANLYLTRSGIGKDGQLNIEGLYGRSEGRSDRTFSLTPEGQASPVSLTYVGNYTDYSFYRTTADFKGGIGKGLSLKAGAAWQNSHEGFRNGGADLPLTASFPTNFIGVPDDFRVARDDFTSHVEATLQRNDWTITGGLKWRSSAFDLQIGSASPFLKRRLHGLDTSFSLEHNLSKGKLSLSLSRLLQLPKAEDLNPSVVVVDVLNRYVGNPTLQPQKAIRAELQYDTTVIGMKAVATLYYRATEDAISFVYEAVDGNVIQSSKINAGLDKEYGLEISVSGKLTSELRLDLSGNIYQAESSLTAFGAKQADSLLTYSAKAALDWSLSDADQLRLDATANGRSLLVQGRKSSDRAASIVWQHTIDPNLSFTLSAQQFLQTPFIVTDFTAPTVTTSARRDNKTTSIQFGIKLKMK